MTNKYDDIDLCLNILYDFAYGTRKECYELKYESKKVVELNKLKKDKKFNYATIFDTKIESIAQHNQPKNAAKYLFKRYSTTGYTSLLKIGIYDEKHKNLNDLEKSELIDMKLNYILSDIALNSVYKFILLPVCNFDIKYQELRKLNPVVYDAIKSDNNDIKDTGNLCVQLFESYYKLESLRNYITGNRNMTLVYWKVIFFQILYALYQIQKEYPTFRHNDLTVDTVYVYDKSTPNTGKNTQLSSSNDPITVNVDSNRSMHIPDIKLEIKITNYYSSYISGYAENKDIPESKKKENQYYDVYNIFSSILHLMKKLEIHVPEVTNLLNEIIPLKLRDQNINTIELNENYYEINISKILSPIIIINKNNFFTDFIKDNLNMPKDREHRSNFIAKENSIDYMLSSSLSDSSNNLESRLVAIKSNKNNAVTGYRKFNNESGNGKHQRKQRFNDFGELSEYSANSTVAKPDSSTSSSSSSSESSKSSTSESSASSSSSSSSDSPVNAVKSDSDKQNQIFEKTEKATEGGKRHKSHHKRKHHKHHSIPFFNNNMQQQQPMRATHAIDQLAMLNTHSNNTENAAFAYPFDKNDISQVTNMQNAQSMGMGMPGMGMQGMGAPGMGMPGMGMQMQGMGGMPGMPGMDMGAMQGMQGMPGMGMGMGAPSMGMPGMGMGAPGMGMPSMPGMDMGAMQGMQGIPGPGGMPGMGMQGMPMGDTPMGMLMSEGGLGGATNATTQFSGPAPAVAPQPAQPIQPFQPDQPIQPIQPQVTVEIPPAQKQVQDPSAAQVNLAGGARSNRSRRAPSLFALTGGYAGSGSGLNSETYSDMNPLQVPSLYSLTGGYLETSSAQSAGMPLPVPSLYALSGGYVEMQNAHNTDSQFFF